MLPPTTQLARICVHSLAVRARTSLCHFNFRQCVVPAGNIRNRTADAPPFLPSIPSNEDGCPQRNVFAIPPSCVQQAVFADNRCRGITQNWEFLFCNFLPHLVCVLPIVHADWEK